MSYYELLEQFWRLYAERRVSTSAVTLYVYLLNEFNTARPHWPALLYRRSTQVYADLGMDKKTLPPAIAVLEERGLIRHYPGDNKRSGEWHLNYGPATAWANSVGKFSPHADAKQGENFPTGLPKSSEGVGKNSPPIRNRQDEEVDKTPTPPASGGAWVGEAAEKIAHAPLPTEKKQVVPPVALTPQPARLVPAAAAVPALPEALAAEAKALASTIAAAWNVTELRNFPKWALIAAFTKRLAELGRLAEVTQQFAAYKTAHLRPGIRPHKLENWLGSPDDDYARGEWCGCDWVGVATQVQARPAGYGQPAPPPARATASPTHQQAATPARHR